MDPAYSILVSVYCIQFLWSYTHIQYLIRCSLQVWINSSEGSNAIPLNHSWKDLYLPPSQTSWSFRKPILKRWLFSLFEGSQLSTFPTQLVLWNLHLCCSICNDSFTHASNHSVLQPPRDALCMYEAGTCFCFSRAAHRPTRSAQHFQQASHSHIHYYFTAFPYFEDTVWPWLITKATVPVLPQTRWRACGKDSPCHVETAHATRGVGGQRLCTLIEQRNRLLWRNWPS